VDSFTVSVDRDSDPITVVLGGELDMATVPTLEQVLDGLEGRICFDCEHLTFVDSSGLAVFSKVDRNGGAVLRNVSPVVRRVLEVVGLDRLDGGGTGP
jgi:anti-anti-sigma factor